VEITITTPAVQLMPSQGAGFAMSGCGHLSVGVVAGVQGTGLRAAGGIDLIDVDRTRPAVKAHVSATAYLPGIPAWSPPI
jgi:hypothetical protein